ncbi:hypothetical protein IFR04_009484 [Cadophora malorum]|uniref:Zn(2)-C6 fungal-type domain-containing protein n=1 Tax=Cadophora malorum TaxID=108018 RepID=A0A8H7W9D0_9HELO|nr:hypothetical protein IFR04_009484 [Cadophora malorum]
MSGSQQPQQGGQRPSGYPSPTNGNYPSPSMSNAQYYPPPNQPQAPEPYRASSTGSNNSMSLPSMRLIDQQSQQQQQQQNMGSGLPPPVAHMGGPYYHNQGQTLPHPSHQYANVTSDPSGQMRYALPVSADSRVMSGGRHKKEIKRRTKTGCLTCRKRRIKCDEQHPACRNCQKSKRECLGYDPIFKQQPGPAAIQPAPSSAPSLGGMVATSNPYGQQPQMLTNYGAPPANMSSYDPALSAGVSSPGSVHPQYDYTNAIDPALADVAAAPPVNTTAPTYQTTSPAKRQVSELLDQQPQPPRISRDITNDPASIEEVKHLYYSIYAPGLENFIESKWYSTKGLNRLLSTKHLMDQFGCLLFHFAKTSQEDPKEMVYTGSVESRTVWTLATMVRGSEINGAKESKAVPASDDVTEATNRLDVFETLLTGRVAAVNPLTAPIPGSTDHHRLRELEFWHTLGNFVVLPYEDSNAVKDVDDTLSALRNLLDGRENRDVLYSIAVIRGLGQRVSEYTDNDTPLHLDESDNKSKLLVAKKFVSDEAAGSGTTNVIRRLCDLAARSWATPSLPPPSIHSTASPEAK